MIDGTFTGYQEAATKTAVYPGQGAFLGLTYATLGLAGEAGETVEQVKKTWRDDGVADPSERIISIIHGLRACDVSHGLHDEDIERAIDSVKRALHFELTEERRQKIIKELGDVLWYAAQICTELGVPMSEVAKLNIEKLAARQKADLLHGEGSDR